MFVDVLWVMGCIVDWVIGEDCKWIGYYLVFYKEGCLICVRGWEIGENLNWSGFYDIGVYDSFW